MYYREAYWELIGRIVEIIDLLEDIDPQKEYVETSLLLKNLLQMQEKKRRESIRMK